MSIDETVQLATGHPRIAIPCLRIEIRGGNDERDMRALGERLGFDVTELVAVDPRSEGAYTAVMLAIRRTGAVAVIVPNLQHVEGIDHWIRQHVELITVQGERVLERAVTGVRAATA